MKKTIFSLFLFGAVLSASPVSVTFVSATSEIGPYTLSVNGKNVAAMCMDDFLHVSANQSWKANVTAVNSSDFSNTYFGNNTKNEYGYSLTSANVYAMEGYLFSQIIKPNADRTHIQEAAWAIMDHATLTNVVNSGNTAVLAVLQQALTSYSSFDGSGYEILSQVNPGCNAPQEFMTQSAAAPEPATFALLGLGFVAAGATRFLRKKQLQAQA